MSSASETPIVDAAQFRRVMGRFASGLTVITAEASGEIRGMTASAFMSGSLDPPLIVISVARKARMHEHLLAAGRFGVNILCADQRDIATHFAGRAVEGLNAAFAVRDGIPILEACETVITATIETTYACGDHTIFLGRILTLTADDQPPLLYHAGHFRVLASDEAGSGTSS